MTLAEDQAIVMIQGKLVLMNLDEVQCEVTHRITLQTSSFSSLILFLKIALLAVIYIRFKNTVELLIANLKKSELPEFASVV